MTANLQCQAAIADGEGKFVIDTVQVRAPQAGEVRVKLLAAGICHTDYASLSWPGPLVMGHEGAGVIEALGEGVAHLQIGQSVLLNWAIPCGSCPQCERGRGSLCERSHGIDPSLGSSNVAGDHTVWQGQTIERSFKLGTFSEYTLVRSEAITPLPTPLPARLSMRCACILGCGVMTGVGSAINVANVQQGDTVVVVGCGGVGLSAIQGARLAGAGKIIAVDQRETSLQRARDLGATDCVLSPSDDPQHDKLAAAIRDLTAGRGADHAFEATGVAALAFLPLKLARNGGNAIQLSGAHGPVTIDMPTFWWDKKYMVPLYGGCQPKRDFPKLFDWAARGELELESMVTHTYQLNQLQQALDDMMAGRCAKGVILFEPAP
ncbi:MAG: alcohol dehydrogenase catalytic domain-containing protein [Burkholderiaceae bacterium]|nr:alcohol dehydrogenase catalytic domain-containing protein [Burkholderiaceae bacterium]